MDRLLKGKDFSKDLKNNSVYPHTLRAVQDAKTAEYYEEVIIPQKIKEAEKKLIEEIERDGKCGNGDIDFPLAEWNKLKQSRGIQ